MQMTPIVNQPEGSDSVLPPSDPQLTGLGPLQNVNRLVVKQKIYVCELLSGCEAQNKFKVHGPQDEILYWAKESSNWFERFVCGAFRSMDMSITDQTGNEVVRLSRPLACMGLCCRFCYPLCTQELSVSINGEKIATIRERATWCFPVYHIFDSVGNYSMKIRGPVCPVSLCRDVTFTVTTNEGNDIATISKKWMGCLKETLTEADNFVINYLANLTANEKVIILSATFLIDMMYFDQSG